MFSTTIVLIKVLVLLLIVSFSSIKFVDCFLYPKESETREIKSLDGIWKFKISPSHEPEKGFEQEW